MMKEDFSRKRKGQREYLKKALAKDFMKKLNTFFESKVEIPRIKHGKRQTFGTLIIEETQLFAEFVRVESSLWVPRIANIK